MINEEIRLKELRLIDEDNNQLGIMGSREALELAQERDLDLVLIASQTTPPVCKIMDYGKYKYETSKRKKEAKKKQKVINVKELRIGLNIEQHDLGVRMNQAKSFLADGDKVKMTVRFRGREIAHSDLALEIMKKIEEALKDVAVVEKKPMLEGKSMIMIVAPKTN